MTQILVDTNVLVSFLTDRDPRQQALAAALFEQAAAGEAEILVHQMVLVEVVFVLGKLYSVPPEQIALYLEDLLRAPGVSILAELSWSRLLDLWPSKMATFTDAALAAVARDLRGVAVATFDQDLSRSLEKLGVKEHWPRKTSIW